MDFSTLIRELREFMNNSKPTRYWGTLAVTALVIIVVALIWKLPELIAVIQ